MIGSLIVLNLLSDDLDSHSWSDEDEKSFSFNMCKKAHKDPTFTD